MRESIELDLDDYKVLFRLARIAQKEGHGTEHDAVVITRTWREWNRVQGRIGALLVNPLADQPAGD